MVNNSNGNGLPPEEPIEPEDSSRYPDGQGFDAVRDVIQDEMGKILQETFVPLLKETSEKILAQIPDAGQVAQAAAEILRGSAMEEAREALGNIPEASGEENGQEVPGNMGAAVLENFRSDPVGTLFAFIDHGMDRFFKFQELKNQSQNPFAYIKALQEKDPHLAQYIGSAMAPDPMNARIPIMLGDSSMKGFEAGRKAGYAEAMGGTGQQQPNPLGPPLSDTRKSGSSSMPGPLNPTSGPPSEKPSTSESPELRTEQPSEKPAGTKLIFSQMAER